MTQELKTQDFEFFILNHKLMVQYLKDDKAISISDLEIEMFGIMETIGDKHTVAILTPGGIQKLKHNVSETLEVIGFTFDDLNTALAVLNFCLYWLEDLKEKEKENNEN